MKTIKVITLCSGYDSQCLALRDAAVPFDLVAWSDIDKVAIKAHDAIFPEYADRNLVDMTKINWSQFGTKDIDLLTYSTPCQDISNEGAKRGIEEGSGTRSSIVWHTEKAVRELMPKILLQENVKALVNKKNAPEFLKWRLRLESYGYRNYFAVLSAKHFGGIPQERERVIMVSLRDDYDIERQGYCFPVNVEKWISLDDIIDKDIESQYYQISQIVYDKITIRDGYVDVPQATKQGFISCPFGGIFDMSFPNSKNRRGRVQDGGMACPTILTGNASQLIYVQKDGRLRNFNPREIFRLMGVEDYYIDKMINAGFSDRQLYFLAGNSIVVPVLTRIFRSLFF